ncbi:hypothetical protein [Methanosphaera cuniculi]|uniref:Core-binding (CB) domain-containing protein n=1 Tax=Methanosphaera cuniculi TaxID=1077256 RepID=A0A2A2HE25_9EURY|nr:hypothetical protein [Methanosphaera cuniculi]PAV07556.1 hypothetical protein ASJ82_07720 [Methanosphaera cuniculi]
MESLEDNKYFKEFCEKNGITKVYQKHNYKIVLSMLHETMNITIDDMVHQTEKEAKQTKKFFKNNLKTEDMALNLRKRSLNQIREIYNSFNVIDNSKYEIKDNYYFKKFCNDRNLGERSKKNYIDHLKTYVEVMDISLDEALDSQRTSDEIEEEIRKYENILSEDGYAVKTINNKLQHVKIVYRHFNKIKNGHTLGNGLNSRIKKKIKTSTPSPAQIRAKKEDEKEEIPQFDKNGQLDIYYDPIFKKACQELNIKTKQNKLTYKAALSHFLNTIGMTFNEFIKSNPSPLLLKSYFNKFQGYMYLDGMAESSVRIMVGKVKKLCKHLCFELPEPEKEIYPLNKKGNPKLLVLEKDPSYNVDDDPLFKKMCEERNLSRNTIKCYSSSLKEYLVFHNMTLKEIVDEAEEEEEQGIRMKNRKIKQRLMDYRTFLIKQNMTRTTINTYLSKTKTVYSHFEIEIPDLPRVKMKNERQVTYFDLPTRDHIREALELCDLKGKALILFMSSSGTARAETLSLTVRDFINGCKEYTTKTNLKEILEELQYRNDVVPTIHLRRIKTDKQYYTFCSPEASYHIIRELLLRPEVNYDDALFNWSDGAMLHFFQSINDTKNWGRVGKYRFFRSHALRKFHASNIGLPTEFVDALEGRSKNKVHETYIKTNPEKLKEKYLECMGNVMIGAIPLSPETIKPAPRAQMGSERKPAPLTQSYDPTLNFNLSSNQTSVTNNGGNQGVWTRVVGRTPRANIKSGTGKACSLNGGDKRISFFTTG